MTCWLTCAGGFVTAGGRNSIFTAFQQFQAQLQAFEYLKKTLCTNFGQIEIVLIKLKISDGRMRTAQVGSWVHGFMAALGAE